MINLSNTTPAAPANAQNVIWQQDASGNVSASATSVPIKTTVAPVAGVLTIDASLGDSFLVNVNAAITSMSITNPQDGQNLVILWQQDGTGHSVVLASNISGAPPVATGASATTLMLLTYNAADTTWYAPTESGVPGVVTSVGLSMPGEFTVSGSPVTSSGTLTATKATQSANNVWAGPTSGSAAAPAFRALVTADLPGGTGTVTSVGMSMPAEFTVSGSPVTTTGTLAATKATQSANNVWAGPTSGSAAAPSFRALVTADLPAGTGTVTSVGLTVPARQTVTGSPVTATGTLAITDNNQNANLVFGGPSSGSAATPAFRSLVTADLPAGTGTVTSVGLTSPGVLYTVSGSPVTASGTFALALISQTANTVLAAPNGSSGNPSFRALATADIPTQLASPLGIGTAATSTMALTVAALATSGATAVGLSVLPPTGATRNLAALFGTTTQVGTTTPVSVSFGGTFGTNTPGTQGNLKWVMFENAGSSMYGIGMSSGQMEYQVGSAGAFHGFWINGTRTAQVNSTGVNTLTATLTGTTPTVSSGQLGLGATTATTATAGAQTLPANPDGFLVINVGGTTKKIPYYAS